MLIRKYKKVYFRYNGCLLWTIFKCMNYLLYQCKQSCFCYYVIICTNKVTQYAWGKLRTMYKLQNEVTQDNAMKKCDTYNKF